MKSNLKYLHFRGVEGENENIWTYLPVFCFLLCTSNQYPGYTGAIRLNERKWLIACELSVKINPVHFSMLALGLNLPINATQIEEYCKAEWEKYSMIITLDYFIAYKTSKQFWKKAAMPVTAGFIRGFRWFENTKKCSILEKGELQ